MTVAVRGADRVRGLVGRRRWALTAVAAVVLAAPAAGQASIVFQRTPGSPKAMYLANDDGTGITRLGGAGSSPVISPDGAKVAYQAFSVNGEGRLRILTLADGTVVTSPQVCRLPPIWSPDSARLICTTETATRRGVVTGEGLVLVDVATGTPQTLVAAPGNDVESASWSPDGTRIAYSKGRFGGSRTDVFVADPAAIVGATRAIRNATTPVWGPQTIAVTRFTSRRVRIGGRRTDVIHSQIWTVSPGGGGAHVLTRYRASNYLVTGPTAAYWTPDGSRLIGEVGGTDFSQLISVDARTGRIRTLQPASERVTYPTGVSADGRVVLFTDGTIGGAASLRTVGITGTPPRRLLIRAAGNATASAGWQP